MGKYLEMSAHVDIDLEAFIRKVLRASIENIETKDKGGTNNDGNSTNNN